MNRTQLEHLIRAASAISGDAEVVVIGSQSIHASTDPLPAEAFMSMEADLYPRNFPDRADLIDGAIGELSAFHQTFGYYAQGVSPKTAVLAAGWEGRLKIIKNENTGTGAGLCLSLPDLLLAKYAAGREKDLQFNRAVVRAGLVSEASLLDLCEHLPVAEDAKKRIRQRVAMDFADGP